MIFRYLATAYKDFFRLGNMKIQDVPVMTTDWSKVPITYMKYGFGEISSFQQEFDSFNKLSQFLSGATR